jgi:hypothetical protein
MAMAYKQPRMGSTGNGTKHTAPLDLPPSLGWDLNVNDDTVWACWFAQDYADLIANDTEARKLARNTMLALADAMNITVPWGKLRDWNFVQQKPKNLLLQYHLTDPAMAHAMQAWMELNRTLSVPFNGRFLAAIAVSGTPSPNNPSSGSGPSSGTIAGIAVAVLLLLLVVGLFGSRYWHASVANKPAGSVHLEAGGMTPLHVAVFARDYARVRSITTQVELAAPGSSDKASTSRSISSMGSRSDPEPPLPTYSNQPSHETTLPKAFPEDRLPHTTVATGVDAFATLESIASSLAGPATSAEHRLFDFSSAPPSMLADEDREMMLALADGPSQPGSFADLELVGDYLGMPCPGRPLLGSPSQPCGWGVWCVCRYWAIRF